MTTAMTIDVPVTAADVATLQLEAEAGAAFPEFTIDTPDEYTQVDAWLSEVVRKKDAALAMRRTATGPAYKGIKIVEGWFAPVISALETTERRLKGHMGAYRVAQHRVEQEARELAAQMATAGDGVALGAALTVAADAAVAPMGRATAALSWEVDRIIPDLLPAEWWMPNEAAIAQFAKAHRGDGPPVVPGVVFKQIAKIGARR